MKTIGAYVNGNYKVVIMDDGTKIRNSKDGTFVPAFAENCDVKITDKCDGGCQFCYEGCSVNGKHGNILNVPFLDTLHPYTELALNGNDLSHPDLIPFLKKLKSKRVIANLTVNQKHFIKNYDFLKNLMESKLINGLGVSLNVADDDFINKVKSLQNVVIHTINGILTKESIKKLSDNNLKLLILGYKKLRRGINFYENNSEEIGANQKWLFDNLEEILKHFDVVSFDNLAINQLEVKRLMSDEEWSEFYMGDDGSVTFYIDLVEGKFAKNSLSEERYDLLDNIDDMFNVIKAKEKKNLSYVS